MSKPSDAEVEVFGHHTDAYFAAKFGRSVESVRRWFDASGLPFRRIGGRRFYADSVVEVWVRTGRAPEKRGRVARRLPRAGGGP